MVSVFLLLCHRISDDTLWLDEAQEYSENRCVTWNRMQNRTIASTTWTERQTKHAAIVLYAIKYVDTSLLALMKMSDQQHQQQQKRPICHSCAIAVRFILNWTTNAITIALCSIHLLSCIRCRVRVSVRVNQSKEETKTNRTADTNIFGAEYEALDCIIWIQYL